MRPKDRNIDRDREFALWDLCAQQSESVSVMVVVGIESIVWAWVDYLVLRVCEGSPSTDDQELLLLGWWPVGRYYCGSLGDDCVGSALTTDPVEQFQT